MAAFFPDPDVTTGSDPDSDSELQLRGGVPGLPASQTIKVDPDPQRCSKYADRVIGLFSR